MNDGHLVADLAEGRFPVRLGLEGEPAVKAPERSGAVEK